MSLYQHALEALNCSLIPKYCAKSQTKCSNEDHDVGEIVFFVQYYQRFGYAVSFKGMISHVVFYCHDKYRKRAVGMNFGAWISSFDGFIWIGLFFTFILTSGFANLINFRHKTTMKQRLRLWCQCIFEVTKLLMRQPTNLKSSHIVGPLLLTFLFMLSLYENSVTSDVIAPIIFTPIVGLREFLNSKHTLVFADHSTFNQLAIVEEFRG